MPIWLESVPGLTVALALFGLCLGSFLNVVIHRVPVGASLLRPKSHCPACGEPVAIRDNVPLMGWLLLRGRCRHCRTPISPRYPMVELLGAICVLLGAVTAPDPAAAAARSVFLLVMVAVFFIDFEHRIIPDVITLPGAAIGILASPLFGVDRIDSVIGAATGALLLWLLGWIYSQARGREGMGGGDIKLAALLGACLGWQGLLLTLMAGSLLGTVIGSILILGRRSSWLTQLPFGSFLAPAAMAVLFWGPSVWTWYLAL